MSTDIDHRITPALHAENVKQIDGYDEDTAAVLAPTETAFSTAYEGIRAVWDARAVADKNPGWTEEQKLLQVDNFARKHLDKITRTFDTTRANLEKGIAHLEQELSQPVTTRAAHPVASEIRTYVRGLGTAKLHSFIQSAIDNGDHDTVTAVLGAPAYLSGLTPEFQQTYLRFYHERNNPAAAKRLKAMQGAKALIEERAGLVFKAMEAAVGGTSTKANKVREAQTAAEKALSFKDA